MMSRTQLRLNILRAYISHVQNLYPNEEDGADRLLLVLRIYEWHLNRMHSKHSVSFDQLTMLKTGVRQAELLLNDILLNESNNMTNWFAGCTAENTAQELANLTSEVIEELTQEIAANEALYPELKFVFDRERAQYRARYEEAVEAEAL